MQVIEEKTIEQIVRKNQFIKLGDSEQELMKVVSDLWRLDHTDDFGHVSEELIPDYKHMEISHLQITFHYKHDDVGLRSHQLGVMIASEHSLIDKK